MEARNLEKNSFVIQSYQVSEDLGIPKAVVSKILYGFVDYIKYELASRKEVRLLGLAYILPSNNDDRVSTTAYQAMQVSKQTGVSYITCLQVIKYYLNYLRAELDKGICVDIRSILSIHPIFENGMLVGYHSSLSESLKCSVSGIRVHTCKLLKGKLNDR